MKTISGHTGKQNKKQNKKKENKNGRNDYIAGTDGLHRDV